MKEATPTAAVAAEDDTPTREWLLTGGAAGARLTPARRTTPWRQSAQNITEVRNLALAAAVVFACVVLTIKAQAYPPLQQRVVWLIGISHSGYVVGERAKREMPRRFVRTGQALVVYCSRARCRTSRRQHQGAWTSV